MRPSGEALVWGLACCRITGGWGAGAWRALEPRGAGVGQAWACSVWNDSGTYKSRLVWNVGAGLVAVDVVITPSVDTWYYLGWARFGTSVRHSVDGVVTTTTSAISGTLQNSAEDLEIGSIASASYLAGRIGYVRITKGVARSMTSVPTTLYPITE